MTLLGEAKREAPAQTELRPTCAEGFRGLPASAVIVLKIRAHPELSSRPQFLFTIHRLAATVMNWWRSWQAQSGREGQNR